MKFAMKIIFLHVLFASAFRFTPINTPKSYQKPNSNIEPFLVTRKEQPNEHTVRMIRSPVRANQKLKTQKSQNQNLHPRRRKQLNVITAYFS